MEICHTRWHLIQSLARKYHVVREFEINIKASSNMWFFSLFAVTNLKKHDSDALRYSEINVGTILSLSTGLLRFSLEGTWCIPGCTANELKKTQTLQKFQILLASLYIAGETVAGYYFKTICYFNLYLALIAPCFDLREKGSYNMIWERFIELFRSAFTSTQSKAFSFCCYAQFQHIKNVSVK